MQKARIIFSLFVWGRFSNRFVKQDTLYDTSEMYEKPRGKHDYCINMLLR